MSGAGLRGGEERKKMSILTKKNIIAIYIKYNRKYVEC